MLLHHITWDVNPEIFRVGSFAIRYYGVLWASGFLFGYLILNRYFRREGRPEGFLDSLVIYTAIGTIVGARLGHCFFYQPEFYLANPLEILKIWRGGLASHGAAFGIPLAIYLFSRKHKVSFLYVMDRLVLVVPLAGFLIRMGNLMNSEIYGIETSLWWGFIFVRDGETVPRHPTQIYEALTYLTIFFIMLWAYKRFKAKPKEGLLFGIFLVMVFGMRFIIEFIKMPQVAFEAALPINMGQILSIPFILLGLWLLYRAWLRKA